MQKDETHQDTTPPSVGAVLLHWDTGLAACKLEKVNSGFERTLIAKPEAKSIPTTTNLLQMCVTRGAQFGLTFS
jgi:hypothetical protein